jgi:hypothetical protein
LAQILTDEQRRRLYNPLMALLLLFALIACLFGAGLNYAASRSAKPTVAKAVLAITIIPICGLWIYCATELWLAVQTNDMRYFGADMAFAIVTIFTIVSVPGSYLGARKGRFNRERSVADKISVPST